MQLRDYQKRIAREGVEKVKEFGLVYLCMEVRTGKTLTALEIARGLGCQRVLFSTKKKAIESIIKDYEKFGFDFELIVVNDESLHKVEGDFDLVVHDEHHRFGAFPKPNKVARLFKKQYGGVRQVYLSGTPFPESYAQVYHQFWVSDWSPFREYKNFYSWAREYCEIVQVDYGYGAVNDYSKADKEKVLSDIEHLLIRFTQKEAGFESRVDEQVLEIDMNDELIKVLRRDKVVVLDDGEVILGDTPVKMQGKIHQLCSGTVKCESGKRIVLDDSKARFIRQRFMGNRIAIFYKYVAELEALRGVFGKELCVDLEVFDNKECDVIALQLVSGREGISLKTADYLVYYNIDFSAVTYWQSRDRLTTRDRRENTVFWIFSRNGIEKKIYKAVMNKKDYNIRLFKKDYEAPNKDNKGIRVGRVVRHKPDPNK